jgi:hypothetical protein
MLGIMRYSTAVIQYNPWETLEKRNRTKRKNKGSSYTTFHGKLGQNDATTYLKGGSHELSNKIQVDT